MFHHTMTPEGATALQKYRRRLFAELRKADLVEGKHYEGRVELNLPGVRDEHGNVCLTVHCYLLGPSRHYTYEAPSLVAAVAAAEADLDEWLREDAEEGVTREDCAQEVADEQWADIQARMRLGAQDGPPPGMRPVNMSRLLQDPDREDWEGSVEYNQEHVDFWRSLRQPTADTPEARERAARDNKRVDDAFRRWSDQCMLGQRRGREGLPKWPPSVGDRFLSKQGRVWVVRQLREGNVCCCGLSPASSKSVFMWRSSEELLREWEPAEFLAGDVWEFAHPLGGWAGRVIGLEDAGRHVRFEEVGDSGLGRRFLRSVKWARDHATRRLRRGPARAAVEPGQVWADDSGVRWRVESVPDGVLAILREAEGTREWRIGAQYLQQTLCLERVE